MSKVILNIPDQYKPAAEKHVAQLMNAARRLWPIISELGDDFECKDLESAKFIVRIQRFGPDASEDEEEVPRIAYKVYPQEGIKRGDTLSCFTGASSGEMMCTPVDKTSATVNSVAAEDLHGPEVYLEKRTGKVYNAREEV